MKTNRNLVISYPKCGRTWLKLLVQKAICEHTGIQFERKISKKIKEEIKDFPWFKHFLTTGDEDFNYKNDNTDWNLIKECKVFLLIRNPLDVIVSYYFQQKYRAKSKYNYNISDFIRDDLHGIRKLIEFYNTWYNHKNFPTEIMITSYEDIHKDTFKITRDFLDFFEIKNVSNDNIKTSVEFCLLKNLNKLEKQNVIFKQSRYVNKKAPNEEYLKFRKGKIKGYTEYLNENDIQYIKNKMRKMNCAFYNIDEV